MYCCFSDIICDWRTSYDCVFGTRWSIYGWEQKEILRYYHSRRMSFHFGISFDGDYFSCRSRSSVNRTVLILTFESVLGPNQNNFREPTQTINCIFLKTRVCTYIYYILFKVNQFFPILTPGNWQQSYLLFYFIDCELYKFYIYLLW